MLAALVVSLAAFTVDGHRLLGLTPARVRATLGAPTRYDRYRGPRLDLVYGSRLEVVTTGRAWSVVVTDGRARDPRLGRILALPPRTLEARIRARTGLREGRRYHCDASGCFGTFFSPDGKRRVIYGIAARGEYVALQSWPLPR